MVFSGFKQKVDEAVAPYLPLIEEKYNEIISSMGAKSKEVMGNDALMQKVFRTVHGRLPLPIRWTLKEQPFVDFCMRHKHRIHQGEDRDAGGGDAPAPDPRRIGGPDGEDDGAH
ncbi:MAG TPA: hypothetical protein VKA13_07950 [Gammaproteobacteria bacterium]|nr:hypothetical protein [Gammaproteobacteria bacterium]